MRWQDTVTELHEFFEAWYRGRCEPDAIAILEEALADDFSMITPGGRVASRRDIVASIEAAHGQRPGLEIVVDSFETLATSERFVVGRYVERHATNDSATERYSTAVFRRVAGGLQWVTVHETWRG